MKLIDESFFITEINIPNTDKESVIESLNVYIARYQKWFLIMLLGRDVYDQYVAAMDQDPPPTDGPWVELTNKLVDQETKESPIAYLVYYWFMRNRASDTTDIGEVSQQGENSVRVSPARKMCDAWNKMSDFVYGTQEWFHDFYATYNLPHEYYFFNLYCFESYKYEFARQNVDNI